MGARAIQVAAGGPEPWTAGYTVLMGKTQGPARGDAAHRDRHARFNWRGKRVTRTMGKSPRTLAGRAPVGKRTAPRCPADCRAALCGGRRGTGRCRVRGPGIPDIGNPCGKAGTIVETRLEPATR